TQQANDETIDLFVREVFREMTTKAGQKCTAIRRAFVPAVLLDTVQQRLTEKLQKVVIGDPAQDGLTMGALASVKHSMEADSVNSAILTQQANDETIDLFVREVFREMTTKAGQKCTAIRR
ncbi:hypothetical protein BUV99_13300, partial [Corynebacterium diphtheriae]